MNQDSSFPPMLPPSTELGALLFAVLPCLQENYRPLASFAYHMTELTRLKNIPSVPPITGLSGIDALITDKDSMLRSLSFYGRMFRMPLLSTIAALLQGMQFYQAYKDILPGLVSGFGGASGTSAAGGISPDLFSMFGGLSPDLLSGLFSGFSGGGMSSTNSSVSQETGNVMHSENTAETADTAPASDASADTAHPPADISTQETVAFTEQSTSEVCPKDSTETSGAPDSDASSAPLFDSLYSFLTPEQQKIYEQLMHTD